MPRPTCLRVSLAALVVVSLSGCARPTRPVGRPGDPAVRWSESFDAFDAARWHERAVSKTPTAYRHARLDGRSALCAASRDGASILLTEVRLDPEQTPWLSWSWRIDQVVVGEDLRTRGGSDAAARLYVYVDTGILPWQKRSLDYVYSAVLPTGTLLESPYHKESKILVASSGVEAWGRWQQIERHFPSDYARAFREAPPAIVGIGLMTDTDNTGASAIACYDDVEFARTSRAAVTR